KLRDIYDLGEERCSLPVCSRYASSATLHSGPAHARNAALSRKFHELTPVEPTLRPKRLSLPVAKTGEPLRPPSDRTSTKNADINPILVRMGSCGNAAMFPTRTIGMF